MRMLNTHELMAVNGGIAPAVVVVASSPMVQAAVAVAVGFAVELLTELVSGKK